MKKLEVYKEREFWTKCNGLGYYNIRNIHSDNVTLYKTFYDTPDNDVTYTQVEFEKKFYKVTLCVYENYELQELISLFDVTTDLNFMMIHIASTTQLMRDKCFNPQIVNTNLMAPIFIFEYDKPKVKEVEKETPDDEIKETFILMKLGNMTLTEVKSLTQKERHYLSKFFEEDEMAQRDLLKRK